MFEFDAFAYATVTVDNTSGGVGIPLATYNPDSEVSRAAKRALITVETADVRFTYDGSTAPTTTVGHLCLAGSGFTIEGFDNIARLRMIRTAGTSATAHVTVER